MKAAEPAQQLGPSPSAHSALALELRNVSKHYPGASAPAIAALSLTVGAGEVCVLVGPSGTRTWCRWSRASCSPRRDRHSRRHSTRSTRCCPSNAMQQMNKAVSIDQDQPATVAATFLNANGVG